MDTVNESRRSITIHNRKHIFVRRPKGIRDSDGRRRVLHSTKSKLWIASIEHSLAKLEEIERRIETGQNEMKEGFGASSRAAVRSDPGGFWE